MHIVAMTDVGLVRKRNEDFFVVAPDLNLVVLCDGMGGHPGGDLASRMAAEEVHRAVEENSHGPVPEIDASSVPELAPFLNLLRGVFHADRKLRAYGRKHTEFSGMGTTIVALQEHEGVICAAHVGDSRLYRLRAGELVQMTQDHSVVASLPESARASFVGMRNILTRALGVGEELEIDFFLSAVRQGEAYLLCTDGLHNFVTEERIVEILGSGLEREECLGALVAEANQGGGGDNITLALAWVEGPAARTLTRISGAVFGDESKLRVQLQS